MSTKSNPLGRDLDEVLEHTEREWRDLKGARIFVTGGTGFIGTWMLESLVWANARLGADVKATVLTRTKDRFAAANPQVAADPAISFQEGDVRDFAFSAEKFSHVIHGATAASAKLNTEMPLEMVGTIVEGTRRTLDFTVECGARQLLQMSSGGVYGRQPHGIANLGEDYEGAPDPMDPWSAYGESKRLAEMLGMLYSKKHGFEHKVARITALVGPRLPLDIHFAMGNFIRDAINGDTIRIAGDGTPYRSYLYIADLVAWLWTILVRGASNRPYNAGSEVPFSIKETAEAVQRVCGSHSEIAISKVPVAGALPSRYVPSTERARTELGLQQWTDLGTGIRRTVDWYRRAGVV